MDTESLQAALKAEIEAHAATAGMVIDLRADLKVQQSRVEAYMATCTKQGGKLAHIAQILIDASVEAKSGANVTGISIGFVTHTDAALRAVAAVMNEKGTHR